MPLYLGITRYSIVVLVKGDYATLNVDYDMYFIIEIK